LQARLTAVFLGLIVLLSGQGAAAPASIRWKPSLGSAMDEGKKTGRLVMIDFYTDWCGWCKKLDANALRSPRVVQLAKQLVPVKVNGEREGAQAARLYGVKSFPTVLFVDRFGKVVHTVGGYLEPKEFAGEMDRALRRHQGKK
jgi:thiol:disulfide interchange protein